MSKLVPNVVDTARIFREGDFVGKFTSGHACICLTTPALAFEISKYEPKARFFADKAMIAFAGGPWFIQQFKDRFKESCNSRLRNFLVVHFDNVEAKDLFSYRNCAMRLELSHATRHSPISLQLVQKAELFAIADHVLAQMLNDL